MVGILFVGEFNLDNTGIIIFSKICYILLSLGLLGVFVFWLAPRPGVGHFLDRRFRVMMFFRTANVIFIAGFVFWELKLPLWWRLAPTRRLLSAYLLGDLANFTILAWYLMGVLYLKYLMDRKTKGLSPGFGSYCAQYGHFSLMVIDLLLILRLEYYYLPLMLEVCPLGYHWSLKIGSLVIVIGLQLLVLLVRSLKMVPAGPEVEGLVKVVADEFKVKIRRVRIWRLERVMNAFAFGIFRKSIYLTETLVESLDSADLQMIVGHECAHFKKHHLELRVILILGLISLGSLLAEAFPGLPLLVYGLYFVVAVLCYNLFARFQEFEADRIAALKLGGGDRMAQALMRIVAPITLGPFFKWLVGHGDLETRIIKLKRLSENR